MKRLLLALGVVAVLIILGVLYFFSDKFFLNEIEPFEAVPPDAAVIFEFQDFQQDHKKIKSSSLWKELEQFTLPKRLESALFFIDTIFNRKNEESYYLVSLHKIKSDDYGTLTFLKGGSDFDKVVYDLKKDFKLNERIFRGTKIYDLANIENGLSLSFANKNGLIISSSAAFLVESAIAQIDDPERKLTSSSSFKEIKELSAKNQDPKIYINFKALPALLNIYVGNDYHESLNNLANFADWMVLDFSILDKAILVSGYASAKNESDLLARLEESGRDVNVKKLLPFNTAVFYYINTLNFEEFISESEGRDIFNNYFLNWTGNTMAVAITEPFSEEYYDNLFLFIQSADTILSKDQLTQLAARQMDVVEVEPEYYKGFEIFQLKEFTNLEPALGLNGSNLSNPFFTIIEDYVVFCNSIGSIKVLLERYLERQTLAKDVDYLAFRKQLTENPAFNFYVNTDRTFHIFRKIGSPSFLEYINTSFDQFKKLNPAGIQFARYKNGTYLVNGLILTSQGFQKKTNLLWKTELDTTTTMQPVLMTNHTNNEREIFIQDEKNNIYLVKNSGEILWKRQIDSRITGEVHQVDFYVNGKLQYLFSTRESIYLIDRNGDFVENFPMRMPAYISSGLAVINYDRTNNYRMFVGCENGNIYGFEKSGKPLQGWNPKRNIGVIEFPIRYLDDEGRDYLIAANNAGDLYLFNRKGETRVPKIPLDAHFEQAFSIEQQKGKPLQLVNMSSDGRLFTIQLNGNYQADSIAEFLAPVYFRYHDVTGDEQKEYVVMDQDKLYVFDKNHKLQFEYPLPSGINPEIYFIPDQGGIKDKIALYSGENSQIYLLTDTGNLVEDFPLRGNSPFTISDLYKNGERIVIVGTPDKTITTYRLR